jgi:DNA invertase Pin-like site-specific DNA recombinase
MYLQSSKITNMHLSKKAILYIRQSTARQVLENNESTIRQYALKEKLIALGWAEDRIVTIDRDLGKSGVGVQDRDGFQMLVADVSNGLVGAIACIECSRLSRSSTDWGRLTQFCAYTNTLLIDGDGVYDPNDFNDRLLLGLKGTMSEAELHFLQERMRGGLMSKAKRGELKCAIPIGYLWADDKIVKDPDIEIQSAVERLFSAFQKTGSCHGAMQYFRKNGFKFPHRVGQGFRKGDVEWINLALSHTMGILHNPFYAGVYAYGKTQTIWTPEGKKQKSMPCENWHVFIKDHHPVYISFEEFEANEKIIRENCVCRTETQKKTPPREGPALMQGLAICGKCGRRMTVQYSVSAGKRTPIYVCQRDSVEHGGGVCQTIRGAAVDEKIKELLAERLTPEAIAASISVQKELDKRRSESLNYYLMRVEKCRYDAELARRRFMNVDPDNRLVALELESGWNVKLKCLDDAKNEYDSHLESAKREMGDRDYSMADGLADSFPKLIMSDSVSVKDKKRMARYLIEDVTLTRIDRRVRIEILYKGHTTQTVTVNTPTPASERWTTSPDVIRFIDDAAETHTTEEICALLNQHGYSSGKGHLFSPSIVRHVMYAHSIPSKKTRYMSRGYVTVDIKAAALGITAEGLTYRIRSGIFKGEYVCVNDKNEYLFPPENKTGQ